MRKVPVTLIIFVIFFSQYVGAATIAVDVSHSEGTVALVSPIVDPVTGRIIAEGMIPALSWYDWGYIGYSPELENAGVKHLGDGITYDALEGVDILIIGQPWKRFSPDEMEAIVKWFSEGRKVLWVAGDCDRKDSAYVQRNVNELLSAIPNTRLRIDYATATDTFSNAGKSAYVAGFVRVDLETPDAGILNRGYQGEVGKVLFHEPGVLAWVDENGKWHPLIAGEIPEGVYRIVTTSGNGMIEDDYAPEARAYKAWDRGLFTLLAVEFVKLPNGAESILIVSGESPYGSPVPIWVNRYGTYLFDGQQFVTNLLRWALLEASKLAPPEETTTTIVTTTTTTEETTKTTHLTVSTTTTSNPVAEPTTATSETPVTTAASSRTPVWIVGVAVVLLTGAAVLVFLLLKKP
ncbi:hypothetical protein [Thermococcus thioreducens]|uniref:Uncharacterized protein n=2 Tax=Thermococcus thioreducens TaxID=277988 RepID=A0A0Q2M567_9EURY|nr:hypothetical protein [Thermococcus thioreducens]ASJ12310.1 hypothetical protein A3L14_05130 [Thermococcus thioreducens]KQH83042.1 hypothetical protein AMR53_02125 [Thermococcus thioreducens]SEV93090.1 hypothetical protein SAMN05216170_0938 [Thermococcus thioreducens]